MCQSVHKSRGTKKWKLSLCLRHWNSCQFDLISRLWIGCYHRIPTDFQRSQSQPRSNVKKNEKRNERRTLGEDESRLVDALGDALEAARAVVDGEHGGHVRQQGLRRANVARRLVAPDVLLARLQR